VEVAGRIYNWPHHWPLHYKSITLSRLINHYKFKWLSDTSLVILSPTPITVTAPDLEQIIEAPPLWNDHNRILNEILTMAKTKP